MSEIASHSHGGWDVHIHIVPSGVVAADESCRYVMQVAPLDGVRRFYVDSLMHSATFLESLIKLVGEDKISLGCDWLLRWDSACRQQSRHTRPDVTPENPKDQRGRSFQLPPSELTEV